MTWYTYYFLKYCTLCVLLVKFPMRKHYESQIIRAVCEWKILNRSLKPIRKNVIVNHVFLYVPSQIIYKNRLKTFQWFVSGIIQSITPIAWLIIPYKTSDSCEELIPNIVSHVISFICCNTDIIQKTKFSRKRDWMCWISKIL